MEHLGEDLFSNVETSCPSNLYGRKHFAHDRNMSDVAIDLVIYWLISFSYANCVEEKEEDVSSSEEEEDANSEKNSVEEEGEIGSEERSSHKTLVVDDIQSHKEQIDEDEGRSS
ncbi:unnamed protein product [Brassica rapa]|uniref:Uncharacterized protein n=2 Tax=Brassica TaxID=3705 RepID=A0A8D9LW97_BRACM|nr:unnamed protein product [Brassica napus]CAG7888957.1 unnamed protein product [Brassica rapa]